MIFFLREIVFHYIFYNGEIIKCLKYWDKNVYSTGNLVVFEIARDRLQVGMIITIRKVKDQTQALFRLSHLLMIKRVIR